MTSSIDWISGRDFGRQRRPLGTTSPWVASIWLRDGSMIYWPSSSWRCGSIRISRGPKVTTAWRWPIGVLEEATVAAQRALRLSSHDPLAAVYLRHRFLRSR